MTGASARTAPFSFGGIVFRWQGKFFSGQQEASIMAIFHHIHVINLNRCPHGNEKFSFCNALGKPLNRQIADSSNR
jgi:hypothetical protein